MYDSLYDAITAAINNDSEAMSELIDLFSSQLDSYSRRLEGEDTRQELSLFLLLLIRNLRLESFQQKNDKAILSYISKSLKHQYFKLSACSRKKNKEMELSPLYEIPYIVPYADHCILESSLSRLNSSERQLIFLLYFQGYSIKDIAAAKNVSVQALNQKKLRILKKLRSFLTE